MSVIVLGIDPGFSSMGWVLSQIRDGFVTALDAGVIRTKKRPGANASVDNLRRAQEIYESLWSISGIVSIDAMCVECMSFPRSSSVAAKVAMSWGVVAGLAVRIGCPVFQASPQSVKKSLTGRNDASKAEIQALTESMCLGSIRHMLLDKKIPAGQHEHAYDAAAVVLAMAKSIGIQALEGETK